MAKDYTVTFTGTDNLSGTVNKIKEELKGVGNTAPQINRVEQSFQRVQNSTMPLKTRLRELKAILALMNADGIGGTLLYRDIATAAGTMARQINGAAAAVKRMSSKTFELDAGIATILGLAGAASVATGAMALFGDKSEEVSQAILKVLSVLGILNGVLAIENSLSDNSTAMLKLKSMWEDITAAAAGRNAVATEAEAVAAGTDAAALGVDAAATAVNTVATGASTIALKVWNVTKAIAKALLGDFTGLILVGAAAFITYEIATSNSTKADKEATKATKQRKEEVNKLLQTYSEEGGKLISTYESLRAAWKKLSNTHQRTLWIVANQSKFKDLRLSILNTKDADNAFINNSKNVIASLMERAKQTALLAAITLDYTDLLEDEGKITKTLVTKGQPLTGKYLEAAKTNNNVDYSKPIPVAKFNATYISGNKEDVENYYSHKANRKRHIAEIKPDLYTEPKPNKTTTNHNTEEEKIVKGSVKWYEEVAEEKKKILENTDTTDEKLLAKSLANYKKAEEDLEKAKIKAGLSEPKTIEAPKFEKGSIADLENLISEILDRLNNENLTDDVRVKLLADVDGLNKQIDSLNFKKEVKEKVKIEPTIVAKDEIIAKGDAEDKNESYENAESKISKITKLRENNGISYKDAEAEVKEINDLLRSMKLKPIKVHIETDGEKAFKSFKEGFSSFADGASGINNVVEGFNTLQDTLNGSGTAFEKFMAVVLLTSTVLETFGTIIQIVDTIKDASTAKDVANTAVTVGNSEMKTLANIKEAGSEAVSGASRLGFPALLFAIPVAIAAVLAGLSCFADGGIIGGSNFHGDLQLARVNAGEMILNTRQQQHLFNLINGNDSYSNNGNVNFVIRGKDLVGTLSNYNSKMGKVK